MKRAVAAAMILAAVSCSNAVAKIPIGNQIAELQSPAIGLSTPVFQGGPAMLNGTAWPTELRHGPALYPGTAYPCTQGTTALAGHHLTNSHPFRRLDELKHGDTLKLTTRYGSCAYQVVKVMTVSPDAVWVLNWGGGQGRRLVLTTCDQIYNAAGQQIGLLRTAVLAVAKNQS